MSTEDEVFSNMFKYAEKAARNGRIVIHYERALREVLQRLKNNPVGGCECETWFSMNAFHAKLITLIDEALEKEKCGTT